jgi:hypothetical protein
LKQRQAPWEPSIGPESAARTREGQFGGNVSVLWCVTAAVSSILSTEDVDNSVSNLFSGGMSPHGFRAGPYWSKIAQDTNILKKQ